MLNPRILLQAAHNKGTQIVINIWRHFITNIKHARGIDCTQGHGYAFDQLAVFEQNQLRATAAQVKNNAVFNIQGINNAQIANISLGIARNNVQLNSRFLGHLGHQLCTVRSIANRRCSYSNNFISLINLAHMRKAAHRIDSAAKGFLRQQIVIINLLA